MRLVLLAVLLSACGDNLPESFPPDATLGRYNLSWACESAECRPAYLARMIVDRDEATFISGEGEVWAVPAAPDGGCVELPDGVPLLEFSPTDDNPIALSMVGLSDPAILCIEEGRLRGNVIEGSSVWLVKAFATP